ncbi:MAG: tetratricopeptide repeat protein [Labilithrix sp.]|nr:tetratricopeptide repeat protein [Labilithrix sp.]
MRKGRSQRKPRGSRPPISSQRGAQPSAGPQVVVGISGHPPAPEEHEETLEARAEAPRLELVRERSLEIVRESLESLALVREEDEEDDEPKSAPTIEEPPIEEPTPTPMVHVAAIATPDEISIPPVGDLAVEAEAEQFFSEGDLGRASARLAADEAAADEWEVPSSAKAKQKAAPHVVERRARFARYVKWAVAGAGVLCLAAVVRTSLSWRTGSASMPKTAAVSAVQAQPASGPEPKAAEPVKIDARPVAHVALTPEAAQAPTPAHVGATEGPKAEAVVAEAPKSEAAPSDPAAALEAKKIAHRALERGKLADAIEAGERSVALDPTDGEAWLVLGAAYQAKGKMSEARRCYSACLREGKRGPRGECRAMLH